MPAPLRPHAARAAQAIDAAGERLIAPLRGHPIPDRLFYSASALADHSLVWHGLGALRGLGGSVGRHETVRMSAALGIESLTVNVGIKSLFRRTRPVHEEERPYGLRTPKTSSFPSGHASAAFMAATLLSESTPRLAPAWYTLATVVAVSRVYVRIHHPTDVAAGAAVGLGIGMLIRKAAPLPLARPR